MPGIPTQIIVADLVFAKPGFPIAEANRPFFNLGAISLEIVDFARSQPELAAGNAPMFGVWLPILKAIADAPGPPATPGIWNNLLHVRDVLGRARKIVEDAKSNFISSLDAKAQLLGMMDEIKGLKDIQKKLGKQVAGLATIPTNSLTAIAAVQSVHKSPPMSGWHPREFVYGSRTGKFFEVLRRRARESGDPQLTAFAAGVAAAYGGALAGSPFINGVVGAPIRNDVWRSRWIGHRTDTWVWGYYRTQADLRRAGSDITFSATDRFPSPRLATWSNVCGANVQEHFSFGGISPSAVLGSITAGTPIPPFLPASVVDLWVASLNEAHPDGSPQGLDAMGLQSAYALAWLTTWIQTSPDFVRAIPPDQINWPDNCGPRPSWAAPDGSVLVDGGSISPPQPSIGDPSVAKIASAIAAALLALANFLMGNVAAGVAALAAGLALLDAGTPPNWDQMGCDLEWADCFIIGLENAFRALLVAAGLAPPYGVELEHNEAIYVMTLGLSPTDPAIIPPDAALVTCRSPNSKETSETYPHGLWSPATSNWTEYPSEAAEIPNTNSWRLATHWPNTFVDGFTVSSNGAIPPVFTTTQVNGVDIGPFSHKPSVLDPDEWELRMERAEQGGNPGVMPFGNAVDLALTIIGAPPNSLQDWDLDSDRGTGWPTWVWPNDAAISGPVRRE
jgi:hypothetical protein